ncbi:hypothetical protein LDP14_02045, partial [Buchnera aphidicola (Stegophylla sp.)]|nr:hypothetical protein [Buchnera aphidicola (Stegophylla sp.)]
IIYMENLYVIHVVLFVDLDDIEKKNIDIIKKYWSYFGLNFQCQSLDIHKIFDNKNRFFMLDIGFGKGESLLHTA